MRLFPQGALVFEVGACIGDMVSALLEHGAGRVVAVEPQRENVASLRKRFAGDGRVIIEPVAVGPICGTATLSVNDGARSCSTFVPEVAWGPDTLLYGLQVTDYQEVGMLTLDALIEIYGAPHFVNMTVVRYEYQALLGLSRPLPWLAFAVTHDTIRMGWAEAAIGRILEVASHTQFNYTERDALVYDAAGAQWIAPFRWAQWRGAQEVLNMLPEIDELGLWGRIHATQGKTNE